MTDDLENTCNDVFEKVGIPDDINPLAQAEWHPSKRQLEEMQEELNESVQQSKLPDIVKDQHADRTYDSSKPYNQDIVSILRDYSVFNLIQKIKATSRALRNSDYVEPDIKRRALVEIERGWEQFSKVLFAIAPALAARRHVSYGGVGFVLANNIQGSFDDIFGTILLSVPENVLRLFKDDVFSGKMGPLLFDYFRSEESPIKKHFLALLLIEERPVGWKKLIDEYIISLEPNSFFLFDLVTSLKTVYKYGFLTKEDLSSNQFLIKKGLAKNLYKLRDPKLQKIRQITNKNLPKREFD